jgi:hypothetical protein
MAVAVFNYAVWELRFPSLAPAVPEPLAQSYFGEASLLLDNTDCSPVADVNARLVLLNLLVAHIAAINGASASGSAGLVGRISEATEGSVTIRADYTAAPGSAQWYAQTPWGAEYWALTANYRTMHYVPGEQPFLGVVGYMGAPYGARRWGS